MLNSKFYAVVYLGRIHMNIALLPSAFYPSLGGVEELTRQLALSLRRKGLNPIVVTNQWPRSLPDFEVVDELPVYRLPMRHPEGNFKAVLSYSLTKGAIVNKLVRILKEHAVELVHVQCISTNARCAVAAKQRLGVAIVTTAQGELTMDAGRIYQRSKQINLSLTELIKNSDFVTGCSQKTLDDLVEHVGLDVRGRSRAIFNGADVHEFADVVPHQHERPYILAFGRLVREKGFDLLLRAFSQAQIKSHDILIAGSGAEEPVLKQLVKDLQIEPSVKFLGRAEHPQVKSLLKGCEFVVMPSRADEGLPVVSVETMAAGKSIIAAAVGGTPEAVMDQVTGILVPREDIAALSAAIKRLIGDTALAKRFGDAALTRARLFSWDLISEDYISVYKQVLSGREATTVAR